jgi:MFS family permease
MDTSMSGFWLGAAFVAPTIAGLLVAIPLWALARDSTMGSAIATVVIMMAVLTLFGREFIEVHRIRAECPSCIVRPRDFTRYSIIGIIGAVDMTLVFLIGLRLDERRRRRRTEGHAK